MLAGFGVTAYYMLAQMPALRCGGCCTALAVYRWPVVGDRAGGSRVFGVPVGFVVAVGGAGGVGFPDGNLSLLPLRRRAPMAGSIYGGSWGLDTGSDGSIDGLITSLP